MRWVQVLGSLAILAMAVSLRARLRPKAGAAVTVPPQPASEAVIPATNVAVAAKDASISALATTATPTLRSDSSPETEEATRVRVARLRQSLSEKPSRRRWWVRPLQILIVTLAILVASTMTIYSVDSLWSKNFAICGDVEVKLKVIGCGPDF